MKKNITRIMLSALSVVLTLSMVLGLAGCAPKGPKAYTTAEELWNAATSKSVKDVITVSAVMDLGDTLGNAVTLGVTLELDRKYKADGAIQEISGIVKTVSITGMDNLLGNTMLMNLISGALPPGISINTFIQDNSLTLNDFVNGSIKSVGTDYHLEGSVDAFGGLLKAGTDVPEIIPAADVNSPLETFGIEIPFDMITLYGVNPNDISKENKATFTGEAGFNYLIVQVRALLDKIFAGTVEFDGNLITVPENVLTIFEGIFGGTSSNDIMNYLNGPNGLIDLGDVEFDVTYKNKKFNTITGTHVLGMAISKTEINRILSEAVELDAGMQSTLNLVFGFLPNTITAGITVTFNSTYTY